jgi:hypothetical protein
MTPSDHPTASVRPAGRWPLAAVLLAVLVAAPAARAQDDEEEEPAAPAPPQAVFMLNDAQFDQWVFGNLGGGNAATARTKLNSLLTLHVEDLDRSCGLSPVQKKKLELAGRGDIKRFFDRVDEMRKKFDKVKNDQNAFGMIWQEIQPLQAAMNSGLFDESSIFTKAVKATLTGDQVARHEEVVRDRLLYRYRARLDLALELLNNSVGFTFDQRERLAKLLETETRPPKRMGSNDYWAVLYQISTVPDAKLRLIFDDVQWRALSRQLAQAKGLGMWLKQNGFVPDEAPPPRPKPSARAEPAAKQANAYTKLG